MLVYFEFSYPYRIERQLIPHNIQMRTCQFFSIVFGNSMLLNAMQLKNAPFSIIRSSDDDDDGDDDVVVGSSKMGEDNFSQ